MKQVVQDVRTGKTRVLEAPIPAARPGTVLVRTRASVISAGTERALKEFAERGLLGKAKARPDLVRQTLQKLRQDGPAATLSAVRSRLEEAIPLGYASAGTIQELGEGVVGYRVGDRVACAGGGYAVHAEFSVVPSNLIAHLPEAVDFESGAFATLGAIALHGFRLASPQLGEHVGVIGLGLIGQLGLAIARAAGCRAMGIDLDPSKVVLARELGAVATLRAEAIESAAAFTGGAGFDCVLICAASSDSDPVELAGEIARDRARVVAIGAVGLEIPRRLYYAKELTLLISRSYGPGRYDPDYEEGGQDYPIGYVRWTEGRNLQAFVELMATGAVDPGRLVTHRFPIDQADQAYELLSGKGKQPYLGVLLLYPDSPIQHLQAGKIKLAAPRATPAAQVRLGALGAGNFARRVAFPLLRGMREVQLVGLATASGARAADAGQRFGFQFAAADQAALLEDQSINTLAVFTRHNLHAGQVAQGLRSGRHVFCEKPLAIDRPGLEQVLEALDGATGILTVGFNRRFAPLALRLKAFLEPIGEPISLQYRVNAGYLPKDHWLHDPAVGGGRVIGEAVHFIDFLIFLTGRLPVELSAIALPDRERYRQDNVQINLRFADGSLGTIWYLAAGDPALPKERLEVFGGGRAAILDDFRRLELASQGRRDEHRLRGRQDKGHRAIWQAFVESIQRGGPAPIAYPELVAASLASYSAVEALRSGQAIPLDQAG